MVVDAVPVWGPGVDTSPPPALWVSSLNTLNLQAECTSLKLVCLKPEDFSEIKQNVLKIKKNFF